MAPPTKKQKKVLWDDESSDEDGGVLLNVDKDGEFNLKINEEYAKRFEYNKKREELARLEEKHGKSFSFKKKDTTTPAAEKQDDIQDEDESSSEEEDEDAALATEALDSEIMATLQAIRNKDPRVYDANVKFYSELDDEAAAAAAAAATSQKKEKPMTLRDYHRQNLMRAAETGKLDTLDSDDEEAEKETPRVKTFDEEQEELKREVVKEMHSAANADAATAAAAKSDSSDSDSDDDFLKPKSKPEPLPPTPDSKSKSKTKTKPQITESDIANADKDPETFLSNFMAARAWLPTSAGGSPRFKPLESDDEEEMARAEKFEEAYNLRFEDPNKINETLTTHDRELVKKYSVRREEVSARKKKREAEKARKEEEGR
ncbi:KRRI-Interacting protein 1 [Ascosphaera pollenicola]|nr:KRRI-Interacting protein 1 [Ascosphaera pollenicola]